MTGWRGRGILAAVVLVVLAGGAGPLLAPSGGAQEEPASCTPRDHEAPTRSEGDVTVEQVGDEWRASKRVTVDGDTGGAPAARLGLSTFGGGVDVGTGEGTDLGPREYRVTADLSARGDTREEARERLSELSVSHDDELDGEVLALATDVERDGHGSTASGDLTVRVPRGPLYDLDVNVGGGEIDVRGPFPRVAANVGGGDITLRVTPWATGAIDLHAGGGDVDALLRGTSEQGFDVQAGVGGGSVAVSIPDGRPVGDQDDDRRHVRTADFGNRSPTTTVDARVDGGSVSVQANQQGEGAGPFCVPPSETSEGAAWSSTRLRPPDPLLSTTQILAGGAAVVGSLVAVWAAFWDRIEAWLLAQYTRLTRREVVEHEARQRILEAVDDQPGIHFRALSRRLDLGHGILEHHLDKLEEAGLLEAHETGSHLLYFPAGEVPEEHRRAIAATKAPGARRVVQAVAGASGPSISEIAEAADVALSTASHHVQRLKDEGVLDVRSAGGAKRVELTDLGAAVTARAPEP